MTTTLPPTTPDTYGTDPDDPGRARTIGGVGELLDPEDVTRFVREAFSTADLDGQKRVPSGSRRHPNLSAAAAAGRRAAGPRRDGRSR